MVEYTPIWLDPADVLSWLRVNMPGPDTAGPEVGRVCVLTEAQVERSRPDQWTVPATGTDPAEYHPDGEVYQGAVMYAARELRRRNSPAGVETFAGVGAAYVSRWDPDIDRALWTGQFAKPGVG